MLEAQSFNFNRDSDRFESLLEDEFVQKFIPKKLQDFEPDLFRTKWFDYRRMTPTQATVEYIKAYGESYRDTYARELDYEKAKYTQPTKYTDLIAGLDKGKSSLKGKLTSFWKGRQIADVIGIPYNLYIDYAFEFRMRRWQRSYLPQPQHLYHEYDVERIQERWEEVKASRTILPEDPAYLVQNYMGIPYQNDFHEWLFQQSSDKSDPAYFLADMIRKDMIPIDKVEARVESGDYDRIRSYLESDF